MMVTTGEMLLRRSGASFKPAEFGAPAHQAIPESSSVGEQVHDFSAVRINTSMVLLSKSIIQRIDMSM